MYMHTYTHIYVIPSTAVAFHMTFSKALYIIYLYPYFFLYSVFPDPTLIIPVCLFPLNHLYH